MLFRSVGILGGCLVAASVVAPSIGHAQADPKVAKSMEALKSMTAKLGAPKLEVSETVGEAPALYFGSTKILISSMRWAKKTVKE